MNFIEMIAQELEGGNQSEPPPSLTAEQQVIRLREVFALRMETHTFRPGQILKHKYPELAEVKGAGDPHIFIEYLETPIRAVDRAEMDQLGSATVTCHYDCIIGFILEGSAFARVLADSRMWKPHTEFLEN